MSEMFLNTGCENLKESNDQVADHVAHIALVTYIIFRQDLRPEMQSLLVDGAIAVVPHTMYCVDLEKAIFKIIN